MILFSIIDASFHEENKNSDDKKKFSLKPVYLVFPTTSNICITQLKHSIETLTQLRYVIDNYTYLVEEYVQHKLVNTVCFSCSAHCTDIPSAVSVSAVVVE